MKILPFKQTFIDFPNSLEGGETILYLHDYQWCTGHLIIENIDKKNEFWYISRITDANRVDFNDIDGDFYILENPLGINEKWEESSKTVDIEVSH